jgi:hypothetical protein
LCGENEVRKKERKKERKEKKDSSPSPETILAVDPSAPVVIIRIEHERGFSSEEHVENESEYQKDYQYSPWQVVICLFNNSS